MLQRCFGQLHSFRFFLAFLNSLLDFYEWWCSWSSYVSSCNRLWQKCGSAPKLVHLLVGDMLVTVFAVSCFSLSLPLVRSGFFSSSHYWCSSGWCRTFNKLSGWSSLGCLFIWLINVTDMSCNRRLLCYGILAQLATIGNVDWIRSLLL